MGKGQERFFAEILGGMGVSMMTTIECRSGPGDTSLDGHNRGHGSRKCNLCEAAFRPRTPFERYCSACKETNELLRFVNWLPEADDVVQSKLPA